MNKHIEQLDEPDTTETSVNDTTSTEIPQQKEPPQPLELEAGSATTTAQGASEAITPPTMLCAVFVSTTYLAPIILTTISMAVIIFVLTSHVHNDRKPLENLAEKLAFITDTIYSKPLVNLTIVNENSRCPSDFEPLLLGTYPGTSKGCYCDSSMESFPRYCKNDETISKSCMNIPSTSHANITTWKGFKFCGKYASEFAISNGKCPEGMVKCSPGYCYPEKEPCPVTFIKVASKLEYQQSPEQFPAVSLSKYELDAENILVIGNEINSTGILQILISAGNLPCLDDKEIPARVNGKYFPLSSRRETGCGIYGEDETSIVVDRAPELKIYSENGLIESVHGVPNLAQFYMGQELILTTRGKYDLVQKSACLSGEYKHFSEGSEIIEKIDQLTWICCTIALIFNSLLMVINLVLGLYISVILRSKRLIKRLKAIIDSRIYTYYITIIWTLLLLILIVQWEYYRKYKRMLFDFRESFAGITENECFKQKNVNGVFHSFKGVVKDTNLALENFSLNLFLLNLIGYALHAALLSLRGKIEYS